MNMPNLAARYHAVRSSVNTEPRSKPPSRGQTPAAIASFRKSRRLDRTLQLSQ